MYGVQSFDSYYYSNRTVKINKSLEECFISLFRLSKGNCFYEKSVGLRSFLVIDDSGKCLYSLNFSINNNSNCSVLFKKCISASESVNMIIYNINSKKYEIANDFLNEPLVCLFLSVIENFNFSSSNFSDLIIYEKELKKYGISRFSYNSNLSYNKILKFHKDLISVFKRLSSLGFFSDYHKSHMNFHLKLVVIKKSNLASYQSFGNCITFNLNNSYNLSNLMMLFIHEFSHLLFDKVTNKLKVSGLNNSSYLSFLNDCSELIKDLKNGIFVKGSLYHLNLMYLNLSEKERSKSREDYLLDLNEIFARIFENFYYNKLSVEERSSFYRERYWYFDNSELEILLGLRNVYFN